MPATALPSTAMAADITTLLSRVTAAVALASDWTTARAAKLDNIPAGTMPLASAVAAIPTTPINSVQIGTITLANTVSVNTATITAVNTARALLVPLGVTPLTGSMDHNAIGIYVTLTNSTTVTAERNGSTGEATVRFLVIEFK